MDGSFPPTLSALRKKLPEMNNTSFPTTALTLDVIDSEVHKVPSRFMNHISSNGRIPVIGTKSPKEKSPAKSSSEDKLLVGTKYPIFRSSFSLQTSSNHDISTTRQEVVMKDAQVQTVSGLLRKNVNSIEEYTRWVVVVDEYLEV